VVQTSTEDGIAIEGKQMVPEVGVLSAVKSRQFFLIAIALSLQFMGFNALVVHIVPYLTRSGFAETSAALIASMLPVISVPGRLIYGWFGDRYSRKWALVISYATQAVGYITFMFVQSVPALVIFLVLFTTGFGGTYSLRPAIQREYFGRGAYGGIQGLLMSLQTIGGVAGPALVAWLVGRQGSYQLSWIIFAISLVFAVLFTSPLKPLDLESKKDG
jgi:OFA family oxalate/formate antiporter-like MFS transporter